MKSKLMLRAVLAAAFAVSPGIVASAKGDAVPANPNVRVDSADVGHCSGAVVRLANGMEAVLTAGHCAADAGGHAITMTDATGKTTPLSVVYFDGYHDLSLMTPASNPGAVAAYDLRCKEPVKIGERVHMTGYPLDFGRITVSGTIASAPEAWAYWPDVVMVSIQAGAGNSGSAVTDDAGKVVGVLVGGRGDQSGMGAIVPVTDLCNPGFAA